MIDTTPEFIAMQDAPAKQRKIGLYLLVMSVVLMFIALGTYTFHQHQTLGQSREHDASVSSQLTSTKKDLAAAKSDNADLTSQNQTLSDTAAKCSVYPAVTRHMSNAMTYELKALLAAPGVRSSGCPRPPRRCTRSPAFWTLTSPTTVSCRTCAARAPAWEPDPPSPHSNTAVGLAHMEGKHHG